MVTSAGLVGAGITSSNQLNSKSLTAFRPDVKCGSRLPERLSQHGIMFTRGVKYQLQVGFCPGLASSNCQCSEPPPDHLLPSGQDADSFVETSTCAP